MTKSHVIFSASIALFLLLSISHFPGALSQSNKDCQSKSNNSCIDKNKALDLKLLSIFSILITSLIGVCLPFFARSIPAFQPEKSHFLIVKSFASGIILSTGFMHVLPDSFDMLSSPCLNDNPWHKFPFAGFVAMMSAVFTLMVDSITTSVFTKSGRKDLRADVASVETPDQEIGHVQVHGHVHSHTLPHNLHGENDKELGSYLQLLRYRVLAIVLELGIVVQSIVIGLSVGDTNNTCTIKGLVAALCFHQMFEGMGLGGCILQAEYGWVKKAVRAFFFAVTTPFGVVLGMALSKTYKENSPESLITVGLLNASSAGLLIYMALVDLLAADFMGQKMQRSIKLQLKSYAAVLLGAGGMSVMAKWA
ncbi:putative zinc transporter 10 [Arabidopsis thaliana]|uniref:ZIP10 n=2 Tax=Arabidopsis TaxID=3701 RepID=A0A178WCX4_ARATH|nr:Zinc/iron permease [Arabidopsis thaliana x Arabidopsis arenosa]OAP15954.1 ZIP10 [Arabidopsis thaliana]